MYSYRCFMWPPFSLTNAFRRSWAFFGTSWSVFTVALRRANVIFLLSCDKLWQRVWWNLCFTNTYKKNSKSLRSVKRAGQTKNPSFPIQKPDTEVSSSCLTWSLQFAGAPLCWNIMLSGRSGNTDKKDWDKKRKYFSPSTVGPSR